MSDTPQDTHPDDQRQQGSAEHEHPTPAQAQQATYVPPMPQTPIAQPGYALRPPKRPGGFRRGFGAGLGFALGLGVVLVVTTVLSSLMFLVSLLSLAKSVDSSASTTLDTVWGNSDASGTLRAIPIQGAILADPSDGSVLTSGTFGTEVATMIRGLDKSDASGIVLMVNTPGGSVVGSAEIADAIFDYRERTGNKVLVHISSMSASGGVYSTSSADEIWASEGSLVGSIGVISGPFQHYTNVTRIGDTLLSAGVEAEKIEQEYLSAGTGKSFGDPFREMSDEEKTKWLDAINSSYDRFVERMVQGRGMDEATIREEMGAALFDTEKAKEYKLIDGVKGRDEFFRYAAEQAGLDPDDTKVEQVVAEKGLFADMMGIERAYGEALPVVQGSGITPALSQAVCSPRSILAIQGSMTAMCG